MAQSKQLRISIVIGILFCLILEPVYGQRWKLRRYEVGAGLGAMQVFGDIGGTIDDDNLLGLKDIKFDETHMVIPAYARYKVDPVYSFKANLALGFGSGDDADSKNDRGRSYKTTLGEFSIQAEYYFIPEEKKYKSAAMFNRRGMINNYMSFSAYGFVGIGASYSKAKVTFTEDINPLVDDFKANSFGMVIPFGLGVKYIIDDRWLLFGELGYRYTLNDYIDGYTQTQGSKHNDVYYFLSFSVGYRLETTRKGLPGFLDRDYRKTKAAKKSIRNQPRNKRQAIN